VKLLIFLLLITSSCIAIADCTGISDTQNSISALENGLCSECPCMKASFEDYLKKESPLLANELNKKVSDIINTTTEILISNLSRLDSQFQLGNSSLPANKSCNLDHLNKLINCKNADEQFKKKGLTTREDFLAKIGDKFTKYQNIHVDSNSCMSKDALNYLMAKSTIDSMKPIDSIVNVESLNKYRADNKTSLSKNPVLAAALANMKTFTILKSELIKTNKNYDQALLNLMANSDFQRATTDSLDQECSETFLQISNLICKDVILPTKDIEPFLEIHKHKEVPLTITRVVIKGVSCITSELQNSVSLLPLVQELHKSIPSDEEFNVENYESVFAGDEKSIKSNICQLAEYDCPETQCSQVIDPNKLNNCPVRKNKISFTDLFQNLCEQTPICKSTLVCKENSNLFALKEYEARSKDITATIATTTTTKDEKTGKETTTTTYETVRRVSSFAKTFHGESKPAGTTLAIPTPKENVAVHVENAAGKDITREVAPEIAARQAERVAPQHAQTNRAVADSNTSEFRSQNAEPKNSERAKWSPSFDPTPTTGRIGDSEMAGYREIIDSLRKTKEELAQTKNADEKKRLQDEIDRLEKEKNRAIAAAAPGSRSPIKPEEDESQTAKPKRNNAVTRDHTAAPTAPTNNPEAYGNVDTNNSPTEAPAANSRPATPANTKAAVVTGGTNSNKKGTGANADASVAVNTAVADLSKADLQIFKEFPVQSQDEIKLSELLAKESEILKGGKAFSIYEVINGKKELVKFEPIKDGATIRFRPIATNENKNLIKKLKTDRLLISTNLNDALKSL